MSPESLGSHLRMQPAPIGRRARALGLAAAFAVLAASSNALATSSRASSSMTPAAASALVPPSQDAFYRYTGRRPLAEIPPGTPLKTRSVTLAVDKSATPLPAEQIQYRTTDATGHAVMSVTTYLLPATGTVAPRVVAYLSFYDALGSQCNPSYTLRGGDPGANNQNNADVEQTVIDGLRASGYIVTIPDFENQTLDYVAGTESGMSSLDGIKATLAVLNLATATPVALIGYSGGSIASDWASELAPVYAPKLNLIGVAEGGVPVNLAHNLAYIDGSPVWSAVIPAAFIGISRSFHLDLQKYLSPYGKKVVAAESPQCIGDFSGKYPGLRAKQLVKPQYANITRVPVFKKILGQLVMGSAPGHPTEPLLMVAGNMDGTGDGVMVAADEKGLAKQYCSQGVPVAYVELTKLEHTQAGGAFFAQAIPYLAARFAGAPPVSNCAAL